MAGQKGLVSCETSSKRSFLIRKQKASQYMPRFSVEEAIRRAGL